MKQIDCGRMISMQAKIVQKNLIIFRESWKNYSLDITSAVLQIISQRLKARIK